MANCCRILFPPSPSGGVVTILGTGGGSGEVAAIVRRQATTEDPSGTALTAPMDESSDDEVEVPWNEQ